MTKKTKEVAKLPYKEFIDRSIKTLRKAPFKGIHVVYTGFNDAFRQYYNEEPRPIVDQLVKEGFLTSRLVRGGVIIQLASDGGVVEKKEAASDTLAKILSNQQGE